METVDTDITGGGLTAITSGTVSENTAFASNAAYSSQNGYPVDGGVVFTAPAGTGNNDFFGGLTTGITRLAQTASSVANAYTTLNNAINPPKNSPQAVPATAIMMNNQPWYKQNEVLLAGGLLVGLVLVVALTR